MAEAIAEEGKICYKSLSPTCSKERQQTTEAAQNYLWSAWVGGLIKSSDHFILSPNLGFPPVLWTAFNYFSVNDCSGGRCVSRNSGLMERRSSSPSSFSWSCQSKVSFVICNDKKYWSSTVILKNEHQMWTDHRLSCCYPVVSDDMSMPLSKGTIAALPELCHLSIFTLQCY